MRKLPFEHLYESIHYPERAFKLFLCPNEFESSEFEPSEFEDFGLLEVPSVFCEALVYFLLKAEKKSGFAKLEIRTEVVKQNQKRLIHWESGTSERAYLDEQDWKKLGQFFDANFHKQIAKHGFMK